MNGRMTFAFLAAGSMALTLVGWSAPTHADDKGPTKPDDDRPGRAEDIGDFVTIFKGFAIASVKRPP